jgi:hypothetical protein
VTGTLSVMLQRAARGLLDLGQGSARLGGHRLSVYSRTHRKGEATGSEVAIGSV